MWVQIHSYSHNVSSGDDLDCFLKGQRGQSFYASYVMEGRSPYVALSLATRAPFTTRLAIASLLRTVWFSERRPRLFARVHFLWLNSLVGSRLQMFSRSYNQCYLRPALIWQYELLGVASDLVMLRRPSTVVGAALPQRPCRVGFGLLLFLYFCRLDISYCSLVTFQPS